MRTIIVAAVLALAGHNNSDGASRFVIGQDGTVEITLELLAVDTPELCGFALPRGTTTSPQLDRCVERLSSWLRLRAADAPCPIDTPAWQVNDLALTITGRAHCDRPAGHDVVIDWGLFAGQEIEHVNTATIVLPDCSRQQVLFSRRHNKAIVAVPDPRGARALVAAVIVGLAGVLVGATVWWRRRRALQQ